MRSRSAHLLPNLQPYTIWDLNGIWRETTIEMQLCPYIIVWSEAFRVASGQEEHGILVDLDIFEKMVLPDPRFPHAVYSPESVDFRLRENSSAIDQGLLLYNINDHFTGKAPDLGALEYGIPMPIYGPRNEE